MDCSVRPLAHSTIPPTHLQPAARRCCTKAAPLRIIRNDVHAPHDDSTDIAKFAARWCLRITVAVQCWGVAWWTFVEESPIFGLLWFQGRGLSEAAALAVVRSAACLLMGAGLFTLWRSSAAVLLPVAAWQLLLAVATTYLGGAFLSGLALPAQAVRIVSPIALLLLERPLPTALRDRVTPIGMLRLAVAATFVAHGWKALRLSPNFLNYLFRASQRILQWELPQEVAETVLIGIGALDLLLAALLLTRRWKSVAFYMAVWGFATAASRTVHSGWDASYESLLRAANGGAALAIALYWNWQRDPPPHSQEADDARTRKSSDLE